MHNLDEHERRLAAAMARISAVAAQLMEPPAAGQTVAEPDTASEVEIARLNRALDEASARNEELSAHLGTAVAQMEASAALEAQLAAQAARIDAQAVDLQRMRMANVQMREALRSLREALEGGVPDAGHINRALQAELDGLRAARKAEVADLDLLLDSLAPLLDEAEAPATLESDDARA
ncbi:hypothetical protein [Gemmobacter nectariphilus]|uniref:hypothetical protein n=1 Tax=Gemmobacter nectariphilus TaxID=220343 RepID=UPI000423D5EF|nr:hypothetical protein [Gemmobacter nectariphilus]